MGVVSLRRGPHPHLHCISVNFDLLICFFVVFLSGGGTAAVVILFSFLIPMSMKVNLEFAKIFYCLQISGDKDMPGSLARNSQIPEQLGRIDYLMMDKVTL